ncbi:hypothetical protein NQ095_13085 [Rossellomorea sp. SC111]|uniref:hypothetical protein n=1 Tax=Rossellomorea sp. SC111 TaxID=2968985 RepID=UPI00215A569F|nr:hypothetical protein [Rossellomorea sp. SC111]MCR8849349.1 hypothetical protein [Rossellomorea sp. SC111]
MKKRLILLTFFLGLGFFYYMSIGFKVDYEEISLEEAPKKIRKDIYKDTSVTGFRVFQEGHHTYVYYKSNNKRNDYITTSLYMRWKAGSIVAMARVDYAANDGDISYDQLIKMDYRSSKDIKYEEEIMSK